MAFMFAPKASNNAIFWLFTSSRWEICISCTPNWIKFIWNSMLKKRRSLAYISPLFTPLKVIQKVARTLPMGCIPCITHSTCFHWLLRKPIIYMRANFFFKCFVHFEHWIIGHLWKYQSQWFMYRCLNF